MPRTRRSAPGIVALGAGDLRGAGPEAPRRGGQGQGGGQKVPVAAGDERPRVGVAEPVHLRVGDVPQPPGDPDGGV